MDEEVKDDLYANMGSAMMYIDKAVAELRLANGFIMELLEDEELPDDEKQQIRLCQRELQSSITGIRVSWRIINEINLDDKVTT